MEAVWDPDNAEDLLLTLDVDLINVEEHLLKANALKHVLSLLRVVAAWHILAVCLSHVGRCFSFDTLGFGLLKLLQTTLTFCMGSISVYIHPLISVEVSVVICMSPGWE